MGEMGFRLESVGSTKPPCLITKWLQDPDIASQGPKEPAVSLKGIPGWPCSASIVALPRSQRGPGEL